MISPMTALEHQMAIYSHNLFRGPPYSDEERQVLESRLYRAPVNVMIGDNAPRLKAVPGSTNLHYMNLHDQTMFNLGECIRGFVGAQATSQWHKNFLPIAQKDAQSLFLPVNRALTQDEIVNLRAHSECYGLYDLV